MVPPTLLGCVGHGSSLIEGVCSALSGIWRVGGCGRHLPRFPSALHLGQAVPSPQSAHYGSERRRPAHEQRHGRGHLQPLDAGIATSCVDSRPLRPLGRQKAEARNGWCSRPTTHFPSGAPIHPQRSPGSKLSAARCPQPVDRSFPLQKHGYRRRKLNLPR
jgi:hypothetical protein